MSFILYLSFTSVLLLLYYLIIRKPRNFPPGPVRWNPFYSWYPQHSFFRDVPIAMEKYSKDKRKKKIFGFFLGRTTVVMVADFEAVKEMLKGSGMESRPPNRPMNEARRGYDLPELEGRSPGFAFSGGRYWKEQRRFVMRHLGEFGFGKSSMEDLISNEVSKLVDLLRGKVGEEAFPIKRSLNISIINALWTITAGTSFRLDDPNLKNIVDTMESAIHGSSLALLPLGHILPHPSLVKLPLLRTICGLDNVARMFRDLYDLVDPFIENHLETMQRDSPRDLMDLLLQENQDCTDPSSPFFGTKGRDCIPNILVELFLGGMQTTSSSLVWTFLYMVHHPEVQDKLHQELDRVCGRDRLPSIRDQDDLPYTNAVLHESFRITGLNFHGTPHYTTEDVKVLDYDVPRGSIVFPCLYDIMNDPEVWKSPKNFDPERFIHPETKKFVPSERVMPFSTGKRICPGES